MHEMVEASPSLSVTATEAVLKCEVDYEQPTMPVASISLSESSLAPPTGSQAQLITVPIASAQPFLTSTPISTIKRAKRGLRTYLNSKKVNRSSSKLPTVLARRSTITTPAILPYPQKPVVLTNTIAPIIPKAVPAIPNNPSAGFTTYLVVDGNQGQFVQVANDGQQPVTFRNQVGQVLQATPINVVSTANQPVITSFPMHTDSSQVLNSSQTITTVRTSSSIDMQQQTTLTTGTTTMTTQPIATINHQTPIVSTAILNGNSLQAYDNHHSTLDESKASNNSLSLSLSQIAQKVNDRHRRSSSSSTSKKKRGRPRLYERDPLTNKPIKADQTPTTTEFTKPTATSTSLLLPGQPTIFTTLSNSTNSNGSLIFSNPSSTISVANPSLIQQHQYSYPSLLNGTVATNILASPTFNTLNNNRSPVLSTTTYPCLNQTQTITKEYCPPSFSSMTPTHNLEISSKTNSNHINHVPLHSSPIKSSNNDIAVHYIGGFVIRESSQPFLYNDNTKQKDTNDQLRCVICQKLDFSHRFFDQEKKLCSILCSSQSNANNSFMTNESIRIIENVNVQQPIQINSNEQIPLPLDHGLPNDPSKWTVLQVGQFIGRLTNENIRQAFYESEIDGQALLLITPEHLRDTMKVKLGPSLVISSEIAKLCERAKTFSP